MYSDTSTSRWRRVVILCALVAGCTSDGAGGEPSSGPTTTTTPETTTTLAEVFLVEGEFLPIRYVKGGAPSVEVDVPTIKLTFTENRYSAGGISCAFGEGGRWSSDGNIITLAVETDGGEDCENIPDAQLFLSLRKEADTLVYNDGELTISSASGQVTFQQ